MLYLTRKIGESIVINGEIELTVTEVRGRSVRLGFTFPENASVLRREIFDRVQAENRAAVEGSWSLDDLSAGQASPPADDEAQQD